MGNTRAMTDKAKNYREPGTGRYAYWNDFDRLCKCGHTLGVHIAGGFECGADPYGKDEHGRSEPEAAGCTCQKFKPSGKRRT